jgi:hypothetical protein
MSMVLGEIGSLECDRIRPCALVTLTNLDLRCEGHCQQAEGLLDPVEEYGRLSERVRL